MILLRQLSNYMARTRTEFYLSRLDEEEIGKLNSAIKAVERDRNVFTGVIISSMVNDDPNATVLPDGSLLISKDLIRILDQYQLTAALGHEAHHAEKNRNRVIISTALTALYGVGAGAIIYFGVLSNQAQQLFSNLRFLDIPALAVASIASLRISRIGTLMINTVVHRRIEYNADKNALRYSSPESIISMLEKLNENENELSKHLTKRDKLLIYLMDPHPSFKKRIRRIEKFAEKSDEKIEESHENLVA